MNAIPSQISYPLPSQTNLPRNTAQWRVDKSRAVLLIHDMQRYFTRFFARQMRASLIQNIAKIRQKSNEL